MKNMKIRTKVIKRGQKIPFRVFSGGTYEHYNVSISLNGEPSALNRIRKVEY